MMIRDQRNVKISATAADWVTWTLKPGFHSNAIACVCCVKFSRNKRKRQPIGMIGRSSGNHGWLLANASACVSCGFRLRNARNASECVWMETGLNGTRWKTPLRWKHSESYCEYLRPRKVLRTSKFWSVDVRKRPKFVAAYLTSTFQIADVYCSGLHCQVSSIRKENAARSAIAVTRPK